MGYYNKTKMLGFYLYSDMHNREIDRKQTSARYFIKTHNLTTSELEQISKALDIFKVPEEYMNIGVNIDLEVAKAIITLNEIYKDDLELYNKEVKNKN